jgi:diacylglycerol kinase
MTKTEQYRKQLKKMQTKDWDHFLPENSGLPGMKKDINQAKRFSICQRVKSFSFALKGILYAFKTQHNTWIHIIVMVLVITAGFIFRLNLMEWGLIVFAIGIVLVSELINTAIESLVDFVSPNYDKNVGLIKDVAAGAVLISAIISVVIGLIIFLPKIIRLIK